MNKKGSSLMTIPIVITICIIMLVCLTVFCFNMILPFVYYQKIDNIATKYIFVIEKFGYLTVSEKQSLYEDLINDGIDISNITLNYPQTKKPYGDLVCLDIKYDYHYKSPTFKEGSLKIEERETTLSVRKNSFSKIY